MASEWFYQAMGKQVGPVSSTQLRTLAQHGTVKQDTPVRKASDGAWVPAERVQGLFAVPHQTPRPVPVDGSAKRLSSSAVEDEPSGMSTATKIVLGVCGAVCMIAVGFLVWFIATRDTWELDNAPRISAKLEEADRLQQSDPLAAYKTYDEVLNEVKQHKIKDEQFAKKLANAENSRTSLYPKVQENIHAEEAEKQRLAEEEAKRATEEKQRFAQEEEHKRAAEAKKRVEEERLKEAIAAYRDVPQSARNALNAVKKLEARTEVGMSYKDYSTAVGEAWGDVKVFAESPEGKKLSDFSFVLVSAMGKYKLALDIWQDKVQEYLRYYPTNILSGALLQQCWKTAHRRINMVESLAAGEDIAAALSKARRLQEIDTNYETKVRSVLADLKALADEIGGKVLAHGHTTADENREKEHFSKRMDDIDKEDRQGL